MEIKLHFLPEKPTESCKVIVYSALDNGDLFNVTNTDFSTYWDLFFMRDNDEELRKTTKEANTLIIAWSYFEEMKEELRDEVLG